MYCDYATFLPRNRSREPNNLILITPPSTPTYVAEVGLSKNKAENQIFADCAREYPQGQDSVKGELYGARRLLWAVIARSSRERPTRAAYLKKSPNNCMIMGQGPLSLT